MKAKRYTIRDLSELTGFSRRTIRYYVQEGLLEPPAGRGRGGFYFDSHLAKLNQIKALQEQGLRLRTIAEMLQSENEPATGAPGVYAELARAPRREAPREVYIRHEIGPGVELHIDRGIDEVERRKITEIVRIARSILKQGRH